jgi:hypothetical protein
MVGNGVPPACVAVAKSKRGNMKPAGLEFLSAAMRSVAAAKAAEPFSRELRGDLEYEEHLLAALIAEAEGQKSYEASATPKTRQNNNPPQSRKRLSPPGQCSQTHSQDLRARRQQEHHPGAEWLAAHHRQPHAPRRSCGETLP